MLKISLYLISSARNHVIPAGRRCDKNLSVTPEFPCFPDIFKFMLVDHDRDQIGIDTECFYKSSGKLFYYCTFLFTGKSSSHPDNYYGHGMVHRCSGTMCEMSI